MKICSLFSIFLLLLVFENILAVDDTIPHINNIHSNILIDGEMDELWNIPEPHLLTYMIDGTNYPKLNDCSGYFKAFWNNDSLFLLVYAVDNIIGTNSANPWENDGFEVYFDMDNSKDTEYKEDNYQFRFNLNSLKITGTNGPDSYIPPVVNFKIKSYPDNYNILEVAFPLVELGMPVEIKDRFLGFDVQILDNDGSGREVAIAWNDNEHAAYYNPSKMGTLFISSEILSSINYVPVLYKVYPNPAGDFLYIESLEKINDIRVMSLDGKILINYLNHGNLIHRVDLKDLNSGLYLVEINFSSVKNNIIRIIKN